MIGSRLTELLLQKGCRVSHLSRSRRTGAVPSFVWDVQGGTMDEQALAGVDTLVHLAGAGIADKRWTKSRKNEILQSRIRSTALLVEQLSKGDHAVKSVVCASAIGYYGSGGADEVFTESDGPGNDFLASVVAAWEEETSRFESLGLRVVKLRVGIVLSNSGGALKEIARPVRWFVGAPLGTGQQLISWIHVDDVCRLFAEAIENISMQGVYNGTAPNPVTNRVLTESIARAMNRKIWLPPIPGFMLYFILGELADAVLKGSLVSSQKIQKTGFTFRFPGLGSALNDLLKR